MYSMHACVTHTHTHTCDVTEPTLCLFDACLRRHVHLYIYVIFPNMMSHQYSRNMRRYLFSLTYEVNEHSYTYVIEMYTHPRAHVCVRVQT